MWKTSDSGECVCRSGIFFRIFCRYAVRSRAGDQGRSGIGSEGVRDQAVRLGPAGFLPARRAAKQKIVDALRGFELR